MTDRAPNMTEKLAAALLALRDDSGERLIPHSDAKLMSASQIISLFHFDHYPIRRADGGSCHPSNLTPRPIIEHREKTATKDQPEMAKDRAIARSQEEFRRRVLERPCGQKRQPTGNFPKGRKLQSRGFQRRRT